MNKECLASLKIDSEPVFITGWGRSGTTLLGNIVDRHPDISVFIESFFIPKYYYLQFLYWPLTKDSNWLKLANDITNELRSVKNELKMDSEGLLSVGQRTYPALIDFLLKEWARSRGAVRWGDKSPGYLNKFPLLHRMYPDAKFLLINRDGRDVCLSWREHGWESNPVTIARSWRKSINNARRYAEKYLSHSNFMEVRYEDLIANPEQTVTMIMEFIGVSFHENLLAPSDQRSINPALKEWGKVNEEIDKNNALKWMRNMDDDEVALFESEAGELLRNMGYPIKHEQISPRIRQKHRQEVVKSVAEGFLKNTVRRIGVVKSAIYNRMNCK